MGSYFCAASKFTTLVVGSLLSKRRRPRRLSHKAWRDGPIQHAPVEAQDIHHVTKPLEVRGFDEVAVGMMFIRFGPVTLCVRGGQNDNRNSAQLLVFFDYPQNLVPVDLGRFRSSRMTSGSGRAAYSPSFRR